MASTGLADLFEKKAKKKKAKAVEPKSQEAKPEEEDGDPIGEPTSQGTAAEPTVAEPAVEVPRPASPAAAADGEAQTEELGFAKPSSHSVAPGSEIVAADDASPVSGDSMPEGLRLEFVAIAKDRVEVRGLAGGTGDVPLELEVLAQFDAVSGADATAWSGDGRWLGLLCDGMLQVVSAADSYEVLCRISPLAGGEFGIRNLCFSPRGTFVACFEGRDLPGQNLAVWRVAATPGLVTSVDCPTWPCLKWTADEQFSCVLAHQYGQSRLQVFASAAALEGGIPDVVLPCESVTTFEVVGRSDGSAVVAVFVPRRGADVARVEVYGLERGDAPEAKLMTTHELKQADTVSLRWNHCGTALLVCASTDVDASGKSYYGSTGLVFLAADGSKTVALASEKKGPVHDAAWRPHRNEFLVLQGDLPCSATLYDGKTAKYKLDCGQAHRNTIRWAPFGRFFCLGGFGQLAGDLDFWDLPPNEKEKGTRLGQNRYTCCVDCSWSADGRTLLGCTTAPRMRVDNRVELFDYVGNRLVRLDYEELYGVSWRPAPRDSYRERPPTPTRSRGSDKVGDTKKAPAYRAPNASGALAARLRAEEEGGARNTTRTASDRAAEAELKRQGSAKKEYRDVQIPNQLVGLFIGQQGSGIRQFREQAKGLGMQVVSQGGQAVVRIGPGTAWDDLDKAEQAILKKVEELQAKRVVEVSIEWDLIPKFIGVGGATIQALTAQVGMQLKVRPKEGMGPKEDRKANQVNDQFVVVGPARVGNDAEAGEELKKAVEIVKAKMQELREVIHRDKSRPKIPQVSFPVPPELVGGLIGTKGATIEELMRDTGVKLKVVDATRGDDGEEIECSKVIIMSADTEAVERAKELIQTKVDSLRAAKSKGKGKRDREAHDQWASPKTWWEQQSWDSTGWFEDRGWGDDTSGGASGEWPSSWGAGWDAGRGWSEDRDGREEDRGGSSNANRGRRWWSDGGWSEDQPDPPQTSFSSAAGPRGKGASKGQSRPAGPDRSPQVDQASANEVAEKESAAKEAAAKQQEEIEELLAKASKELQSGNVEDAKNLYTKVLKMRQRDPVSLVGRSAASLAMGLLDEAYRDASIAIRLQPTNHLALFQKGLAAKALGQDESRWRPICEEVLKLSPDCDKAKQALGLQKKSPAQQKHTKEESEDTAQQKKPSQSQQKNTKEESEDTAEIRAFKCSDCGRAAEWGAKDDSDGQWYCKECWEGFLDEDASAAPVAVEDVIATTPKPERRLWADEDDDLVPSDLLVGLGGGASKGIASKGGSVRGRPHDGDSQGKGLDSRGGRPGDHGREEPSHGSDRFAALGDRDERDRGGKIGGKRRGGKGDDDRRDTWDRSGKGGKGKGGKDSHHRDDQDRDRGGKGRHREDDRDRNRGAKGGDRDDDRDRDRSGKGRDRDDDRDRDRVGKGRDHDMDLDRNRGGKGRVRDDDRDRDRVGKGRDRDDDRDRDRGAKGADRDDDRDRDRSGNPRDRDDDRDRDRSGKGRHHDMDLDRSGGGKGRLRNDDRDRDRVGKGRDRDDDRDRDRGAKGGDRDDDRDRDRSGKGRDRDDDRDRDRVGKGRDRDDDRDRDRGAKGGDRDDDRDRDRSGKGRARDADRDGDRAGKGRDREDVRNLGAKGGDRDDEQRGKGRAAVRHVAS